MNDSTPRFDRQVRAWLDLMPSEAPERVVADVLHATASEPQLRPPLAVALRRPFQMNRLSLFATAAAAVVVVVLAATLVTRPATNVGASSSPSSASSTGAGLGPLPATLVGSWFGGAHPLPGISTGAGTVLTLSATDLAISQSNGQDRHLLTAGAAASGDQLTLTSGAGACSGAGSYTFQLSPSGRILVLRTVADACLERSTGVAGTWWRIDCKNGQGNVCLGELDAGTYASQYTRPIVGPAWAPLFGGLTYTVPDGWANDADWPTRFGLVPVDAYRAAAPGTDDFSTRIELWTQVRAESQATPCSGKAEAGVATRADAMAAWLKTVKGLRVGPPTIVTIGGLHALSLDVAVDTANAPKCGDPDPLVEFQLSGSEGQALGGPTPAPIRLVLIDMADGTLASVWIEAPDAAQLGGFVAEAMPVVQSFAFSATPAAP